MTVENRVVVSAVVVLAVTLMRPRPDDRGKRDNPYGYGAQCYPL